MLTIYISCFQWHIGFEEDSKNFNDETSEIIIEEEYKDACKKGYNKGEDDGVFILGGPD